MNSAGVYIYFPPINTAPALQKQHLRLLPQTVSLNAAIYFQHEAA